MMQAEKRQKAYNSLLYRDYPIEYTSIRGIKCKFMFTPESIPLDVILLCDYAEKHMQVFNSEGNPSCIRNIPSVLFYEIIHYYALFHRKCLDNLYNLLNEYVKTPDSRNLWKMSKHIGSDKLFKGDWDEIRYYWASMNLHEDDKDKWDMIKNMFEALQPWMNHELWKKVKENEKAKRSNVFYDMDPMLAEQMEKEAIESWRRKRNESNQSLQEDDLDEILIEKSPNA